MTAPLGAPRLGDTASAMLRGLSGRFAAVSLAVLAIVAGAVTYAWLAGLVPAAFGTLGWITALLVADLVIAIALVAVLAVPGEAAGELADRLVASGVKIIFNYSESLLDVPAEVTVYTSNPAVDLLHALYFYLS